MSDRGLDEGLDCSGASRPRAAGASAACPGPPAADGGQERARQEGPGSLLNDGPGGDAEEDGRRRLSAGRERALIYKTLVLSGLRKNELASLIVSQLYLSEKIAFAELEAADEKNREGNSVALRADLAADLRDWLADKLRRLQAGAREAGEPVPLRLPPNTPVFTIPGQLIKILDRDLRLACIPKRDDRSRTLDVHALRTPFGSLLSKGGVSPRTAQAAMRHSEIRLTMGV